MLETYFPVSKMPEHLRSGPSGPHIDGFAATLARQGYSADTAVRYLRAASHLGHVLAPSGALPSDIDLHVFSEHLRRCRCPRAKGGRHNHHTIYGARLFHRYLVEIGVCQTAVAAASVEPPLVTGFKAWLRKHRGASDATIKLYARDAAGLLTALGEDPANWDATDIRGTFMDHASTSGCGTIEKMTTSLRAFLRYLAVEGRCRAGLDSAVPAYAHWHLADMPRYLAPEQVKRLIAACDGDAPARRRERAIILLLGSVLDCVPATWRSCVLPILSGRLARCASRASRAVRSACRCRRRLAMRSLPISNADLRSRRVTACSCAE